jgi:hypothetical protein
MTIKIEAGKNLQTFSNDDIVINCGDPSKMASIEGLIKIFNNILNSYIRNGQNDTPFSDFFRQRVSNYYSHFKELEHYRVFEEGKECSILSPNFSKWQKGKLTARLVIDFEPDVENTSEYESPLDEIRREIDQANNQQSGD